MSPMDLLLTVIGNKSEFSMNRNGFYQGNGLEHFLNMVSNDKTGKQKLETWMRPRAIDMVVKEVEREMDDLAEIYRMRMQDVSPEFLMDFNLERHVTQKLEQNSPWFRRILEAAAQTERARAQNTKKDARAVSSCYIMYNYDHSLAECVAE